MGTDHGWRPRLGVAVVVWSISTVALLTGTALAAPTTTTSTTATSTTATAPGTPAAATTTPVPPIPAVSIDITAGQDPAALLTEATALNATGQSSSPLVAMLASDQERLDVDAITAQQAHLQARAANVRAGQALQAASEAKARFDGLQAAVRRAALRMYMADPIGVAPQAVGDNLAWAAIYEQTTVRAGGVLAERRLDARQELGALASARIDQDQATQNEARADAAVTAEQAQQQQFQQQVATLDTGIGADTAGVATDHATLARQAGQYLASTSALQWTASGPIPAEPATAAVALGWAFSELGKPYQWGGTGPASFDCSGLTQSVWAEAGVAIPRVAADQDAWSVPVPLSQLLPGDLVFYGTTDIHHVGIYIGGGLMINAPHTGDVVRVASIWWSDLAGFGRVHTGGIPVAPHPTPDPDPAGAGGGQRRSRSRPVTTGAASRLGGAAGRLGAHARVLPRNPWLRRPHRHAAGVVHVRPHVHDVDYRFDELDRSDFNDRPDIPDRPNFPGVPRDDIDSDIARHHVEHGPI